MDWFDRVLRSLISDVSCIVAALDGGGVDFEIVDGVAALAYVLRHEPSRAFVWPDIQVLVRRDDLASLMAAAEVAGYQGRRVPGDSC